jgi:hypothetical protein
MKALLASSLFLIGSLAAAQTSPASLSQPPLQRSGETAFAQLAPHSLAHNGQLGSTTTRTCAYIHSFVFERNDGEAPKLVKETYCTPTGQFAVKRAFKPGLYPAVLKPENSKPATQ